VTSRKWRLVETAPKVLVIHVHRSEFDRKLGHAIKRSTPIQVNPILELEMVEGDPIQYQVVAIICHEGASHNRGHYVTYMHNELGQWWLFNDRTATLVDCIDKAVNAREVYMCFYVPMTKFNCDVSDQLIGMIQDRTTRSSKRNGNNLGSEEITRVKKRQFNKR